MKALHPAIAVVGFALCGCNGQVTVGVTDAPIDNATAVVIQFEGVDLIGNDGTERFDIDPPLRIDLLTLQGIDREILLNESVPEGDYTAVRLRISADGSGNDSYVDTVDDGRIALEMDEDGESGLRVARTFSVEFNNDQDFTIDFDLRRSILEPSSDGEPYRLAPTLRILNAASVGDVRGIVDPSLVSNNCAPAAYVFEGKDQDPDDVGGLGAPYNTGLVFQSGANTWEYAVGTLRRGEYTVAITCEADQDDPESNDDIEFLEQRNVTIERGETTFADF